MSIKTILVTVAFAGSLAACGDSIGEQTLAGGAIGAGAAAVVGGTVVTGAAIGAAGNLAYCQLNPGKCRGF